MVRLRVVTLVAAAAVLAAACSPQPSGPVGNLTLGADCTAAPVFVPGAQLAGCDLGAVDLSGLDLHGIDLRGANLSGANLAGADLSDANLTSANLTGANLSQANLTNADLSGALLFGTLLVGAILLRTIFWDAPPLVVGNGSGSGTAAPSDGVGTGSQAWNDRGEPWCGPGYGPQPGNRSVRTDAATDFSGAYFTDNELRGLDLRTGNFAGATFNFLTNGQGANCLSMAGGHFQGATFVLFGMQHWDNTNADLRDSTWVHTTLCESDFSGADLSNAQFIGATNAMGCADYSSDGWPTSWPHTVSFAGANLAGARFGGNDALAMQYTSGAVGTGPWQGSLYRDASGPDFTGANLTGLVVEQMVFDFAELASTTPQGGTFANSTWLGAHFDPTWTAASTTWTGSHVFDGATCPDGSTGAPDYPCFLAT